MMCQTEIKTVLFVNSHNTFPSSLPSYLLSLIHINAFAHYYSVPIQNSVSLQYTSPSALTCRVGRAPTTCFLGSRSYPHLASADTSI